MTDPVTITLPLATDEDFALVQAAIAQRLAQQNAERVAAENARLLPLRQVTTSQGYADLVAALPALWAAYRDDSQFEVWLKSLMLALPALRDRAGPMPATPETPEGDA